MRCTVSKEEQAKSELAWRSMTSKVVGSSWSLKYLAQLLAQVFGSSSQVKVVWLRFYLAQVFGSSSQVKVVWLKLFGS